MDQPLSIKDERAPEDVKASINHLFSSHLGISFVSYCVKQQLEVRYSICRNLLALLYVLLERQEENWGSVEAIRSVCMVEIVVLTQAYYVLVWLSDLPALGILNLLVY